MPFPTSLVVSQEIWLKPVELADCAELFAVVDANRSHLRQWLPWLDLNQNSSATQIYCERSAQLAQDGSGWNLLIFHKDRLSGAIGFNWIDHPNRSCELGYWLAKSATGQGVISKCVHRLVEFAFSDLELNRINLSIASDNVASRAVAERLGFEKEGVARQAEWLYDHYVDLVRYAMLRQNWAPAESWHS